MADKKSFVMYASWATMIAGMPEEQAGQLIKAICAHQTGKEYDIADQMVNAIYSMIAEQMDADTDSYAEQCKKRSENAKRQWNQRNAPQKNASAMQKDASASKKMHLHGDTESESDSESDKDINPPTPFIRLVGCTVPEISSGELEGLGCAPEVAEKLSDWIANQAAKRQPITEMDLKNIVSRAKANTAKHGVEAVCKVIEDSLQYKAIIWDRLESKTRDKPKAWQVAQKQDYAMDDLEQRLLAN